MKICNACGLEKPRDAFYKLVSPKYKPAWDCRDALCKICRADYANKRRRKVKEQAIGYKGGKCVDCGVIGHPSIYDFHHIDTKEKDFSLGNSVKGFEAVKSELDKCILLCSNCHRIRHYKEVF